MWQAGIPVGRRGGAIARRLGRNRDNLIQSAGFGNDLFENDLGVGLMRRLFGLALAGLCLYAVAANAATRYVSDQLSVNLRRGPGTEFRIVELVEAGQQVEVLKQQQGWAQVRVNGQTGWVLTRFLADEPAARDRLAAIQARLSELEATNAQLREELATALQGSSKLGQLKSELVAENKTLQAELKKIRQVSANAVRISDENQRFRERILAMEAELERLRYENQALQSRRDGMKVGAVILIAGVLIGLLLPLFKRRSRKGWDSL